MNESLQIQALKTELAQLRTENQINAVATIARQDHGLIDSASQAVGKLVTAQNDIQSSSSGYYVNNRPLSAVVGDYLASDEGKHFVVSSAHQKSQQAANNEGDPSAPRNVLKEFAAGRGVLKLN